MPATIVPLAPKAIAVPLIVIDVFANFALAIEPANLSLAIVPEAILSLVIVPGAMSAADNSASLIPFEPILLIRNSSSYSSVYDFVSRIKYLKDNWFGLGYRSDGTTSLSFGVKANNLHIGYSYDYQLSSNIMSSTYGTHEITLSFYIPAFQHNRHTNYWIF